METETVKLTKYFVKYFVEIIKNEESTYKSLVTTDTDYSPFVSYDESSWEDADEIPEDAFLIKTFETTETVDEEEIDVEYDYYYELYEKEVEVTQKKESFCAMCIYHEKGHQWRKDLCKHEDHLIQDYISGIEIPGDCRDYNLFGQCKLFIENEIEDESTAEESDSEESVEDTVESDEAENEESTDDTTDTDNTEDSDDTVDDTSEESSTDDSIDITPEVSE